MMFLKHRCVGHVLAWVLEIIAEKHQLHQVNLPCHPGKWKSRELGHQWGHHCQNSWGMASCLPSLVFQNLLSESTETEVTASLSRAFMTQAMLQISDVLQTSSKKAKNLSCSKILQNQLLIWKAFSRPEKPVQGLYHHVPVSTTWQLNVHNKGHLHIAQH